MAIQLSDYPDILEDLGTHGGEVLASAWQDAARVFSPRGLENYLRGAASLKQLGKGTDLVVSYIESSPLVAREIGEEAVFDLLSAAIRMYSRTSAAVLALLFSTAPTAATRLGEAELFRGYLSLLDHLLAQTPRAMRPMLEKLDVLLGHLTLGGLRRWALWGVSAHRADLDAQVAYFSLQSEDALTVMRKEQRGVLFVDVQRRLVMYLRALWGRDFLLRPTSGDFETRAGYQPYIEHYFIHLPDAFDHWTTGTGETIPGLELYRASAAHAAAHQVHSRWRPEYEHLDRLEQTVLGLLEDARVERLALREFPGLKNLWRSLLPQIPDSDEGRMGALLDRCALALLDPDYRDTHPWVVSVRASLNGLWESDTDQAALLPLVQTLSAELRALNLPFNPRTDQLSNPYRDDNRHLWTRPASETEFLVLPGQPRQNRRYVTAMEMITALDVEYAGDDAQEIWVLPTELFDDDGISFNAKEGKPPISSPYHYPEWDYQTQLERPNWATLLEKRPPRGDSGVIDAIVDKHKPLIRKLKFLIEAVQPQGVVRQRKVEDGDDIDLNAGIAAMVDIRMGTQPDPRIGIRTRLQIRDLSVVLLLDLSESTNDPIRDSADGASVLDLTREATALLAEAMTRIGDPFAIHGFDSNGRHDVEYFRFKDFDAPYDETVKGRLAAMSGQLSTRMGTALRHAGLLLSRRPSQKKLILLITDGEPADNDVRDPQYLRLDTRRAVEELQRQGVHCFCLTLDPMADQYVARIFGARNYLILDQVTRLPERLPALYLSLTR
jgi:nitric oxide reductase NorD protein